MLDPFDNERKLAERPLPTASLLIFSVSVGIAIAILLTDASTASGIHDYIYSIRCASKC